MRTHGDASLFLPVLLPQHSVCTLTCSINPADPELASSFPSGGGLAQVGEHYVRNVGVAGSTPVPSTTVTATPVSNNRLYLLLAKNVYPLPPRVVRPWSAHGKD